jgi:hypothetical protein
VAQLRVGLRVSTHYFYCRILLLSGLAERSMRIVAQNIEEVPTTGHPLSFCSVLGQAACPIAFLAGDLGAAARYGAMLFEYSERHRILLWQIWASCFLALVSIRRGEIIEGLAVLRRELAQAGEALLQPRFLPILGEFGACLGAAGETAEGLVTVDRILGRAKTRDEGWYLSELLRIKGELLLQDGAVGSGCQRQSLLSRSNPNGSPAGCAFLGVAQRTQPGADSDGGGPGGRRQRTPCSRIFEIHRGFPYSGHDRSADAA